MDPHPVKTRDPVPDVPGPNQTDPYPPSDIANAMQCLAESLRCTDSEVLQGLKPKIGLAQDVKCEQEDTESDEFQEEGSSDNIEEFLEDSSSCDESAAKKHRQDSCVQVSHDDPSISTGEVSNSQNAMGTAESEPCRKKRKKRRKGKSLFSFVKKPLDLRKESARNFSLKCDFCDVMESASEGRGMIYHLNSAAHYSASLYRMDGHTPVSVVEPLQVCFRRKLNFLNKLAFCPSCPRVFPCAYMCALHNKYQHENYDGGRYNILAPLSKETITIPFKIRTCQVCHINFKSCDVINFHLRDQPDHIIPEIAGVPHNVLKERQMTRVFMCPYCNMVSVNSYIFLRKHIYRHHKNAAGGGDLLLYMHLYPAPSEEEATRAVPFDSLDCIPDERIIFNKLVKFQKESCESKKPKKIRRGFPNYLWESK